MNYIEILRETQSLYETRVNCESQLRNGANYAFCEEGASSGRRVRSRVVFPGNRVFPGLRHGFPLTRFTLAPVIVDDATATLTDQPARSCNRCDRYLDRPSLKSNERSSPTRSPAAIFLYIRLRGIPEGKGWKGSAKSGFGRSRNECRGRHQLLAQRGGGLLRSVILRRVFHGEIQHVKANFLLRLIN